ncbi:mitochondrial import inner membrane translocase [Echinococcus multilocularis]|uniref:Mitochondrial import inner membrane translocase n=1 Tax=Echinococcus multilocularis TaxID=6211 RepID=A0A068YGX0_ECHMU|nr:mitochondrial import inner membrane translocase [Echinococcus multilocularis]
MQFFCLCYITCYLFFACSAKYLAQVILSVSRILGRAFVKALQEEYAASINAARARASADKSSSKSDYGSSLSGISLEEAKQILNISDIHNVEEVAKKYDYLFTVNDKKNGGSLYLQSKVFRAKERIDEELQAKPFSSEV